MSVSATRSIALRFIALSAFTTPTWCVDLDKQMVFDIDPQPLRSALLAFANQAHVQVMSSAPTTTTQDSPGARGTYTVGGALTKLLGGTGLHYRAAGSSTIMVLAAAESAPNPATTEPHGEKRDTTSTDKQVDEVIVTGSRIPLVAGQGAQQVKVYSRQQIEQSGQTSVNDFMSTLPEVSLTTSENFPNGLQTFGAGTTVQLHGLPVGATLTLINGHELEGNGTAGTAFAGAYFDLNTIPLAAVERIEVVSEGSSAIYGSDAIAGVVNIVLKKGFDGMEISGRYGAAPGTNEHTESIALGRTWDRGSLSVVGSYFERSELTYAERALTRDQDFTRFGGEDERTPNCNPGNVFFPGGYSFNGGAPVPYAAVPAGAQSGATLAQFATTAGQLNQCSLGATRSVIPPSRRSGVLALGSFDVTDSTEVFTELLYSHTYESILEGPGALYGTPDYQQFSVPASNPFNPFGTPVTISGRLPTIGTIEYQFTTNFYRALVGAKGELPADWHWEINTWVAADDNDFFGNITDPVAIQNALNSTDPATALNPFAATPVASPAVLASFAYDDSERYRGQKQAVSAFVRGPFIELPAGAVEWVLGGEHDRDKLDLDFGTNPYIDPPNRSIYRRKTSALFAETRVPLLGEDGTRSSQKLVATVAARHDHYNDFGSVTTPQFGLEWRPLRSLLFRGSYSEAFRAPPLPSLYFGQSTFLNNPVIDPKRRNESPLVTVTFGGNPNLQPETGVSRTFGLVYSSEALPGLDLSLTHWNIEEDDYIQQLQYQTVVDNEDILPGKVIRAATCAGGPPCPIVQVKAGQLNYGGLEVAGLDYHIGYRFTTPLGQLTPSLSATQTYRFKTTLLPGAPTVDKVSRANEDGLWAPRWKGTASLGWSLGALSGQLLTRYVDSYQDYDGRRELDAIWFLDATLRFDLGEAFAAEGSWWKGSYLQLGGINVLNELPQYSNFGFGNGYDPAQADIRGRFLYGQIGARW